MQVKSDATRDIEADEDVDIELFDPIFRTKSLATILKRQGLPGSASSLELYVEESRIDAQAKALERRILEMLLSRLHASRRT